jgi:hypothetical protein
MLFINRTAENVYSINKMWEVVATIDFLKLGKRYFQKRIVELFYSLINVIINTNNSNLFLRTHE